MPGYELFLRGIDDARNPWVGGNGLRVVVDKRREVSAVERF